jgi:hypothetical protein
MTVWPLLSFQPWISAARRGGRRWVRGGKKEESGEKGPRKKRVSEERVLGAVF